MAKCRACGKISTLDNTHRAGIQLMKHLPSNMDETAPTTKPDEAKEASKPGEVEEEKKEKKKKKKDASAETPVGEPDDEKQEGFSVDSEEIGKYHKKF